MKKLENEFMRFNSDIKIDVEADALRSKRDKLKKDVEDYFPAECKAIGIDVSKSDLRFINQGSYKIGTTIVSNNVDLDYAVIMPLNIYVHNDPRAIKKAIKNSLLIPNIRIPSIKEPCVTVAYHSYGEETMHIDFPIYAEYYNRLYLARGKENSDNYSWEEADPEGLNDYFMNEFHDRDQLRRVVRYIKKWKQVKYKNSTNSHEVPPSVGLTILACQNYKEFTWDGEDDLSSLYYTMKAIEDHFYVREDIYGNIIDASIICNLPVIPYSDVLYKIRASSSYMITFYKRLSQAVTDLRDAMNLSDEYEAAKCVRKVLGDEFTLPEKKASAAVTSNKKEYNFGDKKGTVSTDS